MGPNLVGSPNIVGIVRSILSIAVQTKSNNSTVLELYKGLCVGQSDQSMGVVELQEGV